MLRLFVFAYQLEYCPCQVCTRTRTHSLKRKEPLWCDESSHIHGEIDSNACALILNSIPYKHTQLRSKCSKWENHGKEMLRITNLKLLRICTISIRLEKITGKTTAIFVLVWNKNRGNWSGNQFESNSVCSIWNVKKKATYYGSSNMMTDDLRAMCDVGIINFTRFVILFNELSQLRAICDWSLWAKQQFQAWRVHFEGVHFAMFWLHFFLLLLRLL